MVFGEESSILHIETPLKWKRSRKGVPIRGRRIKYLTSVIYQEGTKDGEVGLEKEDVSIWEESFMEEDLFQGIF